MHALTKTVFLLLPALCCHTGFAQPPAIVIHEIMADPQPSAGLPEVEYVELRNRSAFPVSIGGWRLHTGTGSSGAFPAYTLQPDSLLVLCSRTQASLLGTNTLGLSSFPALPNGGTLLQLTDARGRRVHAVAYSDTWYGDAAKKAGGWSLELVGATNTCGGGGNWRAFTSRRGGTPGAPNAVAASNPDREAPALLQATAPDSLHLLLRFSEPLDSLAATNVASYRLQPATGIQQVQSSGPFFEEVLLTLARPLQASTAYTLTVQQLTDCAGNAMGSNEVTTGLPRPAQPGDLVINELLFNPKPGGADYVELYNRSPHLIDAATLHLASRTASGGMATLRPLTAGSRYLLPGAYYVFSEQPDAVGKTYFVPAPANLFGVADLPPLPDDRGNLVLLRDSVLLLDELNYDRKWHFALLADEAGVALERIDPGKPAADRSNWASAPASAGYGTPTARNAQAGKGGSGFVFTAEPALFSPDGDNFQDGCTLRFEVPTPGFVANVYVFELGGRRAAHPVRNQTLGLSATWTWNGTGDGGTPLPGGTYVLLAEVFNLKGQKQVVKKAVTLVRR